MKDCCCTELLELTSFFLPLVTVALFKTKTKICSKKGLFSPEKNPGNKWANSKLLITICISIQFKKLN